MNIIKIKIGAEAIPTYATEGSAGADIKSMENFELAPGERKLVSTGLFMEIPEGYEIQIRPRSGLAYKEGITVLNSPGTIDSDYRNEVKILLINLDDEYHYISKGERIAQMILSPVIQASFELVEELSKTERGKGGFGSTGKK